jgi:hypothetical protein
MYECIGPIRLLFYLKVILSTVCLSVCLPVCSCLSHINYRQHKTCRSRWPRGLTRRSTACRLLGWRVRIPPRMVGVRMSVCFEYCVLSNKVLGDGRPLVQKSLTKCDVYECDLDTSTMRRLRSVRLLGHKQSKTKQKRNMHLHYVHVCYRLRKYFSAPNV